MRDDNVPSALAAPGEIMVSEETVLHSRGQSEGNVPSVPARSKKNKASVVFHLLVSVGYKQGLDKVHVHKLRNLLTEDLLNQSFCMVIGALK